MNDQFTNRTGKVLLQEENLLKVNQLTNGTPQGMSRSPTLLKMVMNQHFQLYPGRRSKTYCDSCKHDKETETTHKCNTTGGGEKNSTSSPNTGSVIAKLCNIDMTC